MSIINNWMYPSIVQSIKEDYSAIWPSELPVCLNKLTYLQKQTWDKDWSWKPTKIVRLLEAGTSSSEDEAEGPSGSTSDIGGSISIGISGGCGISKSDGIDCILRRLRRVAVESEAPDTFTSDIWISSASPDRYFWPVDLSSAATSHTKRVHYMYWMVYWILQPKAELSQSLQKLHKTQTHTQHK